MTKLGRVVALQVVLLSAAVAALQGAVGGRVRVLCKNLSGKIIFGQYRAIIRCFLSVFLVVS